MILMLIVLLRARRAVRIRAAVCRRRRVTVNHGVPRLLGHGGRQLSAIKKDGTVAPMFLAINAFEHNGATFIVGAMTELSTKVDNFEAAIAEASELMASSGATASGGTRSRVRVVLALVAVAFVRCVVFGLAAFSLATAADRVAVVTGAQRLRFDAAMLAFDARETALSNVTHAGARERLVDTVAALRTTRSAVRFGKPPAAYRSIFLIDPSLTAAMEQLHFGTAPDAYAVSGGAAAEMGDNGLDSFILTYAAVGENVARAPARAGANASTVLSDARVVYLLESLARLDSLLGASAALYLQETVNIFLSVHTIEYASAVIVCTLLAAMHMLVSAVFARAILRE